MNTIEQAREVSARLHLGVSIADGRNIDKDFAILAKAAGNTIDALIAELKEIKSPGAQPLADGYQLVPIEPTRSMLQASEKAMNESYGKGLNANLHCYRAMLEAAKP